jgi:hypothetical protein
MRPPRARRGLSAFLLALYLGAGFGVPLADAFVFHSGRTGAPAGVALEGDLQGKSQHDFCRLAQHSPDTVAPAAEIPAIGGAVEQVAAFAPVDAAPRDAAPAGLPPSRAPPLA